MNTKVIIPEESYSLIEFNYENLPGIAVINSSLKNFKSKEIFPWRLSIKIDCKEIAENGMPSKNEVKIIDAYGDLLDTKIKGDKLKPDALFLARVTLNGVRELIWRLHNADLTNDILQQIILENNSPREFDYEIDEDEAWELDAWFLKNM